MKISRSLLWPKGLYFRLNLSNLCSTTEAQDAATHAHTLLRCLHGRRPHLNWPNTTAKDPCTCTHSLIHSLTPTDIHAHPLIKMLPPPSCSADPTSLCTGSTTQQPATAQCPGQNPSQPEPLPITAPANESPSPTCGRCSCLRACRVCPR